MKYLLMILVTILIGLPHTGAQTFAYNEPIIKNQSAYSALYMLPDDRRNERYAHGMVVAGIITMGVGAGAAVLGIAEYSKGNNPNDHQQRFCRPGHHSYGGRRRGILRWRPHRDKRGQKGSPLPTDDDHFPAKQRCGTGV